MPEQFAERKNSDCWSRRSTRAPAQRFGWNAADQVIGPFDGVRDFASQATGQPLFFHGSFPREMCAVNSYAAGGVCGLLGQILLHAADDLFGFGNRRILEIFAEEYEIALPAVLNMAGFDETVIFARIGDVLDGNVPVV
jgi:hypothetical protein